VRGNVQALFGGEGLVFLSNQDPTSYPTLFARKTLTGRMVQSGMYGKKSGRGFYTYE
jgi:3-hydroxyacyl-CoA dehydrogenase